MNKRNKICAVCKRKFSSLNQHNNMSRCGRYWNNTLTEQDKKMIKKVGLDKAIKRNRNVS